MGRVFTALLVIFVVVGGTLVYQSTKQTTSLVLLPSDLLSPENAKGRTRIRVGGRVANLPIDYQVEPKAQLKFSIHDPGQPEGTGTKTIPVVYEGLRPDMFAAGRDVIIDGEWSNGQLIAAKLLTQCPSKYEPPKPKR